MWESEFCHGKHLKNVAPESALDIVQIDVGKVVAHDLLRGIVDKNVYDAVLFDVLLYCFLAFVVVHQVSGDQKTLLTFLFHQFLGLLSVVLLFGKVNDRDIGPFTCEQNRNSPANARTIIIVSLTRRKWGEKAISLSASDQSLAALELACTFILICLAVSLQLGGLARGLHTSFSATWQSG